MLLLTSIFIGCPSAPYEPIDNENIPDDSYITFDEVSQSYLDLYGEPEKIENWYEALDFYYVEWWWKTQGIMVCFVQTSSNNFRWSIDHISEWIALEEVVQPYIDLYGEPFSKGTYYGEMIIIWGLDKNNETEEMLTVKLIQENPIADWIILSELNWVRPLLLSQLFLIDLYGEPLIEVETKDGYIHMSWQWPLNGWDRDNDFLTVGWNQKGYTTYVKWWNRSSSIELNNFMSTTYGTWEGRSAYGSDDGKVYISYSWQSLGIRIIMWGIVGALPGEENILPLGGHNFQYIYYWEIIETVYY